MKEHLDYEIVVESECVCKMGESPYWDEHTECLKFVDINEKKLLSYNPKTKEHQVYDMLDVIGSANSAGDDKAVVALWTGLYIFDYKTGAFEMLFPRREDEHPASRFNDSKCDAKGRLLAGTTSMDRLAIASLYSCTEDMKEVKSGLTISNGMAWTMDNKILYHIDTWPRKIYKCDYDLETGAISEGKIAFDFPEEWGMPDGMTIDSEDMLWICFWGGSSVRRIDPSTGEVLVEIKMPVKIPTCCTFGGEDYSTLYITSAVADDTSELAGSLFSVKLPYHGIKHNSFKYGK